MRNFVREKYMGEELDARRMKGAKNKYYPYLCRSADLPLKSKKREDILKWIHDINVVDWYVTYLLKKRIDDNDVRDMIQDIWVEICKVKDETWKELYRQGQLAISGYVVGLVRHQIVNSRNDTVSGKYRKWHQKEITQDNEFWERYYEQD